MDARCTRGGRILAGLVAALALAQAAPSRQVSVDRWGAAGPLVVVAADDAGQGSLVGVRGVLPFDVATPVLSLDPGGLVRADFGRLVHVSRASGVVTLVDAGSWSVARSFDLGHTGALRDVAVVSADTAWLSRADASSLLRLDLESGAVADAVDLAPLDTGTIGGGGADDLAMETMLRFEGRLYVQLARAPGSALPSAVAVVDLATATLVDADPLAPGVQPIELAGRPPRLKMQVVPGTRRLMLGATGSSLDFGGFELIDLESLASQGIVLAEFLDVRVNDLGPFVMLDGDRGWYSGSTDFALSSHLHQFTLSGGGLTSETASVLFYFSPHLAFHRPGDTLYWPVPGGLRAFDATTGRERTAGPTVLPGDPTDLTLLTTGAAERR